MYSTIFDKKITQENTENDYNEREIDWIKSCQLEFGLIFSDYGLEKAAKQAFDIVKLHDMKFNDKKSQKTYSLSQHNLKKEAFIASNGISTESNFIYFVERFLKSGLSNSPIKYWFDDEESKLAIYFGVYSEQLILDIPIKPRKLYSEKIKKALKEDKPYPELEYLFKQYGYFYQSKVTIGAKLDRIFEFYSKDFGDKINKSNLKKDDLQSYLEEFKKSVKPFDSSYLCDYNLDPIKTKNIEKWLASIPDRITEWRVIKRQVTPLYHILGEPIRKQVDYLLGSESRILMSGRDQVNNYKWIKFTEPLHKANYHIFGRIISESGDEHIKAVPKFKYFDVGGFGISIESSENKDETQEHTVVWIMVGTPYEIKYSDPSIRNIEIVIGSTPIKEREVELNINQILCPGYILTASFIYPYSNVEPNFVFKISSWSSRGIITLEITRQTPSECNLFDNEEKAMTLSWCLILVAPTKFKE
ncbi:11116_t:CDS:2, partial [Ambispora gerdemannii]